MQCMLNFLCKIDLKREPKEQSQEVKTQETNPQKRKKKKGGCVIGNHRDTRMVTAVCTISMISTCVETCVYTCVSSYCVLGWHLIIGFRRVTFHMQYVTDYYLSYSELLKDKGSSE